MVGENVKIDVYPLSKAKELAAELELDLVEISPNATPPVCKIIDYKKFLYEQKKREKDLKSKASKVVIKEFVLVRIRTNMITNLKRNMQ